MARISVCLLLSACLPNVSAFSVHDKSSVISRRDSFSQTASLIGGGIGASILAGTPLPSLAVVTDETPKVTTRMGGLLENYQDSRGWTILAPSGWNKFDGEVGAYDIKWQDLVDPTDNIKLSSTPVKSTTTSVDVLGPVDEVGAKLASKRNAKLIAAMERQTDGILFYAFDFALDDGTHQLLQLCVNKGKIWSLDANTKEKKYAKRKDMYYNVMGSFMPKLA
jgi:photosystem II oxygen-evolving enhancer protein 2